MLMDRWHTGSPADPQAMIPHEDPTPLARVVETECSPPLQTIERDRTRFCAAIDGAGVVIPSGAFVAYHDEQRRKKARSGEYRGGRKQGIWLEWYPSGSLRSELAFRDDQANGSWREWDEEGGRRNEGQYENGEEDGPWRFWYPDGGLSEQGTMLEGVRDGEWTGWYPNGRDRYRRTYRQGRMLSWEEWDTDGKPVSASDRGDSREPGS